MPNIRSPAAVTGGTIPIDIGIFSAGSASAPSITFTGDLNTGMYSPGADQIGFATGGTLRLSVSTTAITSTLPITATALIPSSSTIPTNGLYLPAANTVGIATNGGLRVSVSAASGNTIFHVEAPSDSASAIIELGSTSDSRFGSLGGSFDGSQVVLATSKVDSSLVLQGGDSVTNLTLSGAAGSELATFVKDVTAGGLITAGTLRINTAPSADAALVSTHSYTMSFNGTNYKVMLVAA